MTETKVWCIDCGCWHKIDSNKPLMDALPGHTWAKVTDEKSGEIIDNKKGFELVRFRTHEDELEDEADEEICPTCGVPHGPNPYTGCNLP